MAALTTALNTEFTPLVGDFNVQCTVGLARLERKNAAGAAWAVVGDLEVGDAKVVSNPIAGAIYQFVAREPFGDTGTPIVRADQ